MTTDRPNPFDDEDGLFLVVGNGACGRCSPPFRPAGRAHSGRSRAAPASQRGSSRPDMRMICYEGEPAPARKRLASEMTRAFGSSDTVWSGSFAARTLA